MEFLPDLEGSIDIQPGATVSKVVSRSGPLRLVLFAFDEGEELTEHTASVPVVLQVVSGSVAVGASGDTRVLDGGGWVFLEASEPHTVQALEPAKLLLTMVRGA